MKKNVVIIILLLSIMTAISASADTFKLHSGVEFGMTPDEIIAKEKEKGNSFAMVDNILQNQNKISVIDENVNILYHFDTNQRLIEQSYHFTGTISITDLYKTYQKVYGTPDASSDSGTTLTVPRKNNWSSLPTAEAVTRPMFGNMGVYYEASIKNLTYYQWLVEYNDGYAAIELYGAIYYVKVGNRAANGVASRCHVDYRFFTKEEIQQARETYSDKLNDI